MLVKVIDSVQDVGFLNLFCGGIGRAAAETHLQRYEADRRPFSAISVGIDTDSITSRAVDQAIQFGLSGKKLNALKADPALFGAAAETICDRMGEFLTGDDVTKGSRTIRTLTQVAFAAHQKDIAIGLRNAIHRLVDSHRVKTIIPVIVGSSGGGTGSALQILLPYKLLDNAFRQRILQGFDNDLLQSPICFVSDPYALAHIHDASHAAKILANAYAFRIESAELERMRAIRYVVHVGFSNSKGTILRHPDLINRVLGTSVYEWERGWPELGNRFTDTADVNALSETGYVGKDLPEIRWPERFATRSPHDGSGQYGSSNLEGGKP